MCLSVIYFHFISFILALSICFLIAFFEIFVLNLKTWKKHLCVISKSPKMRSEKRKKSNKKLPWAIQIYQAAAICSKAINEGNASFYPDRGISKLLCGYCRLLVFFSFKRSKDSWFTRVIKNVKKDRTSLTRRTPEPIFKISIFGHRNVLMLADAQGRVGEKNSVRVQNMKQTG